MSETRTEYRIEYDYPYTESRGETDWTPAHKSYEEAYDWMSGYHVTAGYGRVLRVQKRFVEVGDWEETE